MVVHDVVMCRDLSSSVRFVFPCYTDEGRDAIANPTQGETIHNTTTAKMNFYNGTAWVAITSAALP